MGNEKGVKPMDDFDSNIDWGMMYGRTCYPPAPTKRTIKRVRLRPLTKREKEERLERRFIEEAKIAGRYDLLDDETGVAFRNWKRMNETR